MIQVPTSPIGVVPWRMSKTDGEPPQTIGAPVLANWQIVIPLRHSAVCWTTAAARGTPPGGGGGGQTSKAGGGFWPSSPPPPAAATSISLIVHQVSLRKAPVMIGL